MTVGRWARQHASHAELDTAVATAIDNLNNNPPPTNYQHRRRALDGWLIPAEVWEPSIDTLRRKERELGIPRTTDWGPRKRHSVSLLLWSMLTHGDYLAAPLYRNRTLIHPTDDRFHALFHFLLIDIRNKPGTAAEGTSATSSMR